MSLITDSPRFLVFAGKKYYPEGGAEDLVYVSNSYEKAVNRGQVYQWCNIYDILTNQIVYSTSGNARTKLHDVEDLQEDAQINFIASMVYPMYLHVCEMFKDNFRNHFNLESYPFEPLNLEEFRDELKSKRDTQTNP